MNQSVEQDNPFRPGTGALPPVLAGREQAKRELTHLLTRLTRQKRGADSPALLIGPRGSGKTALIAWFENHARDLGVDTVRLSPNFVQTIEELAEILSQGILSRLSRAERLEITGELGVVKGGLAITQGSKRSKVLDLIEARARRKPLLLVVDEVHELDTELGCDLLNTEQIVKERAPFMLLLAGTPNSEAVLNAMHATFWDRSVALGIGLLSTEAAREAIETPLSERGVHVADSDSWASISEQVQGFPYFVQLMGSALWRAALDRRRSTIGRDVVEQAIIDISSRKMRYYNSRRRELSGLGLLNPAVVVAHEFSRTSTLSESELHKCLSKALVQNEVVQAISQFTAQGYVWMPPEQPGTYVPGIPSLMKYILMK